MSFTGSLPPFNTPALPQWLTGASPPVAAPNLAGFLPLSPPDSYESQKTGSLTPEEKKLFHAAQGKPSFNLRTFVEGLTGRFKWLASSLG
jgi:hypothetical protein